MEKGGAQASEREELRRKLRDKIKNKRRGGANPDDLSQRLRNDPAGALMSLGIEDPAVLKEAKAIVANPQKMLSNCRQELDKTANETRKAPPQDAQLEAAKDSQMAESDEDLPPMDI